MDLTAFMKLLPKDVLAGTRLIAPSDLTDAVLVALSPSMEAASPMERVLFDALLLARGLPPRDI